MNIDDRRLTDRPTTDLTACSAHI